MSEKHSKPNESLIETPVNELCGNPAMRSHPGQESSVYGLPGPQGVSAELGADPVLLYTDITPHRGADTPSDSKLFQGQSPEK